MRTYSALAILLIVAIVFGQGDGPKAQPVPDSATAIKVAEAALIPVYGKKLIESEEPFTARLKGDVWIVYGTLRCQDGKGSTTTVGCRGGVAEVQVSKIDGRILSITHGR